MTFKYGKQIGIGVTVFAVALGLVFGIKSYLLNSKNETINSSVSHQNNDLNTPNIATTEAVLEMEKSLTNVISTGYDDLDEVSDIEPSKYPYLVAPTFKDDGSIIYDGMTITELTDLLNKSLNSYMTNTGYYFADYTKRTGINPYLTVAIVLLETGCKWKCSTLTVECNNIGGLKGSGSCRGGSYSKYNSLDEGITAYLDIIYKNYYLKGMDTPEKMASKYAASSEWSNKVNTYINEIKSK